PHWLLTACIAAQALGVGLLAEARSLALLVGYVVVYGFAFGAVNPLHASVMAEHFGGRAYGSITGVHGLATWAGAGLGPLAAGWLYDRTGGYSLALWLAVAALGLSSFSVGITRSPGPTPTAPVEPRRGVDVGRKEARAIGGG